MAQEEIMVNNQERFMNPYTDFGFKKLFGTEPNKDNLNAIAYSYEKGEKDGLAKGQELGLAEGKELGIAEGEAKANKATAHKMLSAGMSKEAILEMTGWPDEVFSS